MEHNKIFNAFTEIRLALTHLTYVYSCSKRWVFLYIVEGERGFVTGKKRTYAVSVSGNQDDRNKTKETLEECLKNCSVVDKSRNYEFTEGRCDRNVLTFTLVQPFDRPSINPHDGCDHCTDIQS